jgi:ATP-dependent Clp protease adaptor protein ClpS
MLFVLYTTKSAVARMSIISFHCLFLQRMRDTKQHTKPLFEEEIAVAEDEPYQLIVWNDDVNTFDWVIETLMTVCGHTQEQAEQCALFIHYKGKYAVKQGSYDELEPMCTAITDRHINATIEQTVG